MIAEYILAAWAICVFGLAGLLLKLPGIGSEPDGPVAIIIAVSGILSPIAICALSWVIARGGRYEASMQTW